MSSRKTHGVSQWQFEMEIKEKRKSHVSLSKTARMELKRAYLCACVRKNEANSEERIRNEQAEGCTAKSITKPRRKQRVKRNQGHNARNLEPS